MMRATIAPCALLLLAISSSCALFVEIPCRDDEDCTDPGAPSCIDARCVGGQADAGPHPDAGRPDDDAGPVPDAGGDGDAGEDPAPPDAGEDDGGIFDGGGDDDAGSSDGGQDDGGPLDGGDDDAGPFDGGDDADPFDGGDGGDAGSPDAGPVPECTPASTRCAPGADVVQTCDVSGVWVDTETCDGRCDDANGTCLEPTCDDQLHNGAETGIDCGGADCPACTATFVLDATDVGNWNDLDAHNVGNTLTGWCVGCSGTSLESRAYLVFDLSEVTGTITEVRLLLRPNTYNSGDASEALAVYDVSTALATVKSGSNGTAGVFTDLGSGELLGQSTLTSASVDAVVEVPFDANGIAFIEGARPAGQVAVGLSGASLSRGQSNEWMKFDAALADRLRRLVVTVEP